MLVVVVPELVVPEVVVLPEVVRLPEVVVDPEVLLESENVVLPESVVEPDRLDVLVLSDVEVLLVPVLSVVELLLLSKQPCNDKVSTLAQIIFFMEVSLLELGVSL